MESAVRITIAIATFNCINHFEQCIESIIHQKYPNFEIIIVDGQSTDGTTEIIKEYVEIYNYISFVSEPDKGVYDAMNKALCMATGDYLIFLGSDDHFVANDVLERVSYYLKNNDTIYYGNVLRSISEDIYCQKFNRFKLAVKNICHQSIFYPRSVYKAFQYSIRYKLFADYVYNLHLWNKYTYEYIPLVITYFSQTGISSTNIDEEFKKDYAVLRKKKLGFLPYWYSAIYHFIRNMIVK